MNIIAGIPKRGLTELNPLLGLPHAGEWFVMGGYARWALSPNQKPALPEDLDIYCKTEEVYKSILEVLTKIHDLRIRYETDHSVSFSKKERTGWEYLPPIQLIKPVIDGHKVAKGSIEEILDNFDFTIARAALTLGKVNFTHWFAWQDEEFEKHERQQKLVIKNIHCPVGTALRACKYVKKGYKIKMTEIVKLFLDWEERDIDYRFRVRNLNLKITEGESFTMEEKMELYTLLADVD